MGCGLLWGESWFPRERWYHVISHVAFCAAAGILLFVTRNPGFSIGVCISGAFSLLYHDYLASSVRNIKIANRLAILDYSMIVIGAAVGIILELPLSPSVSWPVWASLGAAASIYILGMLTKSRLIHAAWHVASVSPVIFYAILDSGRTGDKLYGQLVLPATLIFMLFVIAVIISVVWSTTGHCSFAH